MWFCHRQFHCSGGSRISKGAPAAEFGAKIYYLARYFAEDCMKIEEIGLRGRRVPVPLLIRQCLCDINEENSSNFVRHMHILL